VAVGATASALLTRRRAFLAAIFAAIAAAIGVAVFRPAFFPGAGPASDQLGRSLANVQALGDTVADIFAGRSPGERLAGALAMLKHRRAPILHQRALPKIRKPASPLAGIVAAPPVPPVIPPAGTPLYNVVNAPPVPVEATPSPGGAPVIFPGFTPPPGGGGGVIIPPAVEVPPVTPPVTPPITPPVIPPTTPGVPEPTTWAMMLMGFLFIARAYRQHQLRSSPIAAH